MRVRFLAPTAANGLANLAMYTLLLAVPVLLSDRGVGPAAVGFVASALTAGMAVMGPIGGRLADAFGRRRPPVVGLAAAVVAGCVLVATAGRVSTWWLVAILAAFGVGLGSSYASLSTAALEAVSAERAGAAAGAYSSGRYVGSIVGSLLLAQLVERAGDDLRSVFVLVLAGVALAMAAATRVEPWPAPAHAA